MVLKGMTRHGNIWWNTGNMNNTPENARRINGLYVQGSMSKGIYYSYNARLINKQNWSELVWAERTRHSRDGMAVW